jgi:hypothetical protein
MHDFHDFRQRILDGLISDKKIKIETVEFFGSRKGGALKLHPFR